MNNMNQYQNGYQTDFQAMGRQVRNNTGAHHYGNLAATGAHFHKSPTDAHHDGQVKKSYQPIPDGRFYTKANFFTLADR